MSDTQLDPDRPAMLGGRPLFGGVSPDWPPYHSEVVSTLKQMASDGSWGRYFGPYNRQLIEKLQQMNDCEHVLLCSSGRAAVELALRGLNIESGHEVALSDYDFHSNFASIHLVGAMPVLVDVRENDAQLDIERLTEAQSPTLKAVIASHLHGGVVEMTTLREIADERGLAIIEDACQAAGARVAGRPAGMWGDVGILSFGGSKLLTAGRGGALLTNRADVMQRIRRYLRGDNHMYPLSEMQAAVLLPQLDRLAERHQRRATAVAQIDAALSDFAGLKRFSVKQHETSPAYYKVGFRYEAADFDSLPRDALVASVRAEGLAFDAGLSALHTMHNARRYRVGGELPMSIRAGQRVVGLHHPVLLEESVDWSLLRGLLQRIRIHADELRNTIAIPDAITS